MLYKLVNPSDDYSFHAPDNEVALIVGIAISDAFPVESETFTGPLLRFMGRDKGDEWFQTNYGKNAESFIDDILATRRADIIKALRTVTIKLPAFEAELAADPNKDTPEFADKWHDTHRTSLFDIREAALSVANGLEA